jgi:hypothetical protein
MLHALGEIGMRHEPITSVDVDQSALRILGKIASGRKIYS